MTPIEFVERGGAVKRYHAMTTLISDTVGQHSFHVAWLATFIWQAIHKSTPRAELLLAALSHDLAEQEFGDIPAPTKRAVAAMEKVAHLEDAHLRQHGFNYTDDLTLEEKFILKLADYLDGLRFCNHELDLGNSRMMVVRSRYITYIKDLLAAHQDVAHLLPPILAPLMEPNYFLYGRDQK